ncbi:MAG TPA: ribulokinase [Armatimonadota bacterium]|nr:ribulokinase [Armatimonadota bacterium]
MSKYTIGVDFGTLSGRALLVDVADGREVATAMFAYTNAVMDDCLPDGTPLGPDWALQDPADYLRVLETTIPSIVADAGITAADVIGIAIDFTACTMLPATSDGTPLCFLEEWRSNPHAWVKLWKHHAAQPEANEINRIAAERGEAFLARYGGKISSEWMFAKALQILHEAPNVYAAADRMLEAADWVIWQLTGNERRNSCTAGYKAMWSKQDGYPDKEFLQALHPDFANFVDEKLSTDIYPLGAKAGELQPAMAQRLGLLPGIAVAVANVDAHVAVPACTVVEPGKMVMIMGTSICHMVCGTKSQIVPGMCGVVEDGILPGLFGFEAGQSAVGDIFAWFVDNCVPGSYEREAAERGISVHELLTEKAAALKPGESGLLALDWWNGNRSILVDTDLTGLLLGCTLTTKPEEIYRALIEATAYGTAMIVNTFAEHGVPIDEIYCCGGLAMKNALLMQIYADVTGRPMRISASNQTPALGSAMHAAVAAGSAAGGYDTIQDAATVMARVKDEQYEPIPDNQTIYHELYAEYVRLHDYLGRGDNDVMKRLKALKEQQRGIQATV